jgi:hypothetical protein
VWLRFNDSRRESKGLLNKMGRCHVYLCQKKRPEIVAEHRLNVKIELK